jgi:hypothetical protein
MSRFYGGVAVYLEIEGGKFFLVKSDRLEELLVGAPVLSPRHLLLVGGEDDQVWPSRRRRQAGVICRRQHSALCVGK